MFSICATSGTITSQTLLEKYECEMYRLQLNLEHIIRDTATLKQAKQYSERRKRWDEIGKRVNYIVSLPVTVVPEPVEVPEMYEYDIEALKKKYGISFENFVFVDHHIEEVQLLPEPLGGVVVSEFHYTKQLWKWK